MESRHMLAGICFKWWRILENPGLLNASHRGNGEHEITTAVGKFGWGGVLPAKNHGV